MLAPTHPAEIATWVRALMYRSKTSRRKKCQNPG
jgi:hypothetical protein